MSYHRSKLRSHVLLAMLGVALLFRTCAASDLPAGLVFYESGRTLARTSFSFAVLLKDDGVYEGLYFLSTGPGAPPPPFVLNLEDGTWEYHRMDDKTAELTIRSASGSGPISGTRTLQFSSATAGAVQRTDIGSGVLSGGEFRLVSRAGRIPLTNCSNRAFVRNGSPAFTGFVIADTASRAVLIRAVGPGLVPFGVASVLKTPRIVVRSANQDILAQSAGWTDNAGSSIDGSAAIRRTSAMVGAFALPEGSKDSATILELQEGAYVAEVASADSMDSGEVLIEVYMLP